MFRTSRTPLITSMLTGYLFAAPFLNSYQAVSDLDVLRERLFIYEKIIDSSSSSLQELRQHYRQEIFACIASSEFEGDLKYYQLFIPGYYYFCSPEKPNLEDFLPHSFEWYLNTNPQINSRYEDV